jgi:hypothetical protein
MRRTVVFVGAVNMNAVLIIDMLEDFFREGPLAALRGPLTERINVLCAPAAGGK